MNQTHRHWRLLTLAVLSGTTASLWAFTAPSASAVDRLETAVWWRDQTGAATLPPPPQVPPGGLWVSSDPVGPSAISAVRFTLTDSEGLPKLSLRVAKLTTQPASPVTSGAVPIRACMVTHDWTPPATVPGKWGARPSYDCTKGSVSGQLSPDLSTLVFDLTVLPAVHSYDLVIVPGADVNVVAWPPAPLPQLPAPVPPAPDPTQAIGSPTFDVAFEPLKPNDLSVFPTSPAQAAAPPAASLPADTSVGRAPLASLDVPAAPAAVAPVPAAATPAAVLPIATRTLAGPVAKVAGTSRTSRVIAGVVFCALAAWAWRLLAADSATGIRVADGRPALSRHDAVPLGTEAGLRRRFTTSGRNGTPPALR